MDNNREDNVKITHDVEWPGQIGSSNGGSAKWGALRAELDKLYVGGSALVVALSDEKEAAGVQATVSSYGKKQNCKAAGWEYKTTKRGNSVFVHKTPIARR